MYITLIFNKDKRIAHQQVRSRLDILRMIAIKTDEEQKEFIDLKFPKTAPFKWTFINVGLVVFKIFSIVCAFIFTRYLWRTYIGIELPLWLVMIIMIILPMFINKILKKYNLHQDDLSVFFGGKVK
jgi:hypothetical protein